MKEVDEKRHERRGRKDEEAIWDFPTLPIFWSFGFFGLPSPVRTLYSTFCVSGAIRVFTSMYSIRPKCLFIPCI